MARARYMQCGNSKSRLSSIGATKVSHRHDLRIRKEVRNSSNLYLETQSGEAGTKKG